MRILRCRRAARSRTSLSLLAIAVGMAAAVAIAVGTGSAATDPLKTALPYGAKYIYGANWKARIGKKADPKKAPIYIGWVHTDGGLFGRPWMTREADVAVKLINNELDGVADHRVVLVKCLMTSQEEEGQKCAQRMLNDKRIQVIAEGDTLIGGASFFSTIDGKKPVFGALAYGPEPTAKNTYMLTGGIFALGGYWTFIRDRLKSVKSFLFFNVDTPITRFIAEREAEIGRKIGLNVKTAYYPPGATDVVGPLTAADPKAYDAMFAGATDSALCIAVARAIKQLSVDIPTFAVAACSTDEVKKGLGDLPKWYIVYFHQNVFAPASPAGPVALYNSATKKYGTPSDTSQWYAPLGFAQMFTAAKVFNSIGPDKLTSDAFAAKMGAFTGPSFMTGPNVKFGVAPLPAIGNRQSRIYLYLGNGKWKDAAGGQWLVPPDA